MTYLQFRNNTECADLGPKAREFREKIVWKRRRHHKHCIEVFQNQLRLDFEGIPSIPLIAFGLRIYEKFHSFQCLYNFRI